MPAPTRLGKSMELQKIKTKMIKYLGEDKASYIQGLRFYYLIKIKKKKKDQEVLLAQKLLKEGDVAIDIGANGADWTSMISRFVGKSGKVFAFEADPYYAKSTKHTIKLLGLQNISFFSIGLSNKNERLPLQILDDQGNRLTGKSNLSKTNKKTDLPFVTLKPLDEIAKEYSLINKVKFIKCDVEGFELFVFQGAKNLLKTARPTVVLEFGSFDQYGYSKKDLYNFFVTKDYSFFIMDDMKKLKKIEESNINDKHENVNRIFVPNEKIGLIKNFSLL